MFHVKIAGSRLNVTGTSTSVCGIFHKSWPAFWISSIEPGDDDTISWRHCRASVFIFVFYKFIVFFFGFCLNYSKGEMRIWPRFWCFLGQLFFLLIKTIKEVFFHVEFHVLSFFLSLSKNLHTEYTENIPHESLFLMSHTIFFMISHIILML